MCCFIQKLVPTAFQKCTALWLSLYKSLCFSVFHLSGSLLLLLHVGITIITTTSQNILRRFQIHKLLETSCTRTCTLFYKSESPNKGNSEHVVNAPSVSISWGVFYDSFCKLDWINRLKKFTFCHHLLAIADCL